MKNFIRLYRMMYVIFFLTASCFALIAQNNIRVSAAISSGWYHTFQNAPGAGESQSDPQFENKYNFKELKPFAIELLFHHLFSNESDAARIGFHLLFLSVRQTPKLGSQSFVNLSEQQPRTYKNVFLSVVLQKELYEHSRSQILLDLSLGLSFISVNREPAFISGGEISFPNTELGFQIGFDYLFRFLKEKRNLNYFRIGPRYHFQTDSSFPFSSGFLLDIGLVIQIVDNS